MSTLLELFRYIGTSKKYWLAPILLIILLFAALVVLSQGSAVAPFIYTLF